MSLTALQAIVTAITSFSHLPNHRIISEKPIDGSCTALANKETFVNGKWTKYQCDYDKKIQIVYEMIDENQADDEIVEVADVSDDQPREIDWAEKVRRQKMAEERYEREAAVREAQMREMREQEMRDRYQERQQQEMLQRARKVEEERMQQQLRQQQKRGWDMRQRSQHHRRPR